MLFLHPALMWLLPLAAIPVVLHLLALRRLKTVELSTYRFLFDTYIEQRRRIKLLEALLAILRTLFILLLVLVTARPLLQKWHNFFGIGQSQEVVLLVDCSASMAARTAGLSALDRAKTTAKALVEQLPREDRVTLVRVTTKGEPVFSRFRADADSIRAKIDELEVTPAAANLFNGLTDALGSSQTEAAHASVYLLTDCQAAGWRELRDQPLEKLLPEGTKLTVVHTGSSEPMPNHAVLGNAPRRQQAIRGLPVLLQAKVANFSKTESAELPLSLIVDEKEVARAVVAVRPGQSVVRDMVYTPTEAGPHRARFEIPADRFPDDDTFLFNLQVSPQVKILLVNGQRSQDPLEDEALYLRAALSASDDSSTAAMLAGTLPGDAARALEVREIAEGELNANNAQHVDVIILANCGGLHQQQFELLRSLVHGGTGLLIFPGERVNPEVYNRGL